MRAHLSVAAEEIDDVIQKLDVSETACCNECGLKKKTNWAEFKLARELTAISQKLKHLAGEKTNG